MLVCLYFLFGQIVNAERLHTGSCSDEQCCGLYQGGKQVIQMIVSKPKGMPPTTTRYAIMNLLNIEKFGYG